MSDTLLPSVMDRETKTLHLSPSRLVSWLRCPRAFYFQFLQPKDETEERSVSPHLAFGALYAECLHIARTKDIDEAVQHAVKQWKPEIHEINKKTLENLETMLWLEHQCRKDSEEKIVRSEIPLKQKAFEPSYDGSLFEDWNVYLCGYVDTVIEIKNKFYLLDDKTCGAFPAMPETAGQQRIQFHTYRYLADKNKDEEFPSVESTFLARYARFTANPQLKTIPIDLNYGLAVPDLENLYLSMAVDLAIKANATTDSGRIHPASFDPQGTAFDCQNFGRMCGYLEDCREVHHTGLTRAEYIPGEW